MIRLALFQPEIPHNTGTLLRLSSCLHIPVDIIEPCGFIWNHSSFKRTSMDYFHNAIYERFMDFDDFLEKRNKNHRLIAVSPYGKTSFMDFQFDKNDILLMGKESTGLPQEIIGSLDSIFIPMKEAVRSLNLAISSSIVLTEALRQTGYFSEMP